MGRTPSLGLPRMQARLNMTVERTGIGRGYSQSEALDDWLENDESLAAQGIGFGREALDTGHPIVVEQLMVPRRARRIHTDNYPQKGQRKFATAYRVVDPLTSFMVKFEGEQLMNDVYFSRQMDAIAAAKELAKETHQSYTIEITKVLVSGNLQVAKVTPGKSMPGEYRFTGQFKY